MSAQKDKSFRTSHQQPISIYLAGPEVFLLNPKEIGRRKKALCEKYGFVGVFPIDAELDVSGLTPREAGMAISRQNEELLRSSTVVVANMTPFRGPSADVGTVFEVGFAHGLKKIVCAYTNTSVPFTERCRPLAKSNVDGDLRDDNGMEVEQFGLMDNLMLEGGIKASGGILVIEDAPKDELFTYLGGFEKCLVYLKKLLSEKAERV